MANTIEDIKADFSTRTESLELLLGWHRKFAVLFSDLTELADAPDNVMKQSAFHTAAVIILERSVKDRKIFKAALDMGRIPAIDELDHETLEQIEQLRTGETDGTC